MTYSTVGVSSPLNYTKSCEVGIIARDMFIEENTDSQRLSDKLCWGHRAI